MTPMKTFNKPTLSTATRDEIEHALADTGPENVARCGYCGVVFTRKNKWQVFCCKKHRESFHNEGATREIERLQAELAAVKRERDELRKELAGAGN